MNNYISLLNKIEEFIRKYYLNEILKGLILFFTATLVIFFTAILLEYFGQFNSNIRTVIFYSFLIITIIIFSAFLAKPLLGLFSIRRDLTYEKASQLIGSHFKEVEDKLQNLLELKEFSKAESDLLNASIDQKISELNPVPFKLAINFKENVSFLKYLVVPLVLILSTLIIEPNIVFQSTSRLVAHDREFIPMAPYEIQIENQDLSAFKRESYKLKIKVEGMEIPNTISIEFNNKEFRMKKESDGSFTYIFNSVEEKTSFYFNDGSYKSKKYILNVLPKPLLKDFRIEIQYPKYLKKENEVIKNTGDIIVPEGSFAKWFFKTEDTDEIFFRYLDSSYKAINSNQDEYSFNTQVKMSSQYQVSIENSEVDLIDTFKYKLQVIKDKYPTISVKEEIDSNNINQISFLGKINDDYGFSKLQFIAYKYFNGSQSNAYTQNIGFINGNESPFMFSINTSKFNLNPEEKLIYFFQVWDNDGINGPKSSKTLPKTFKAKSIKELEESREEKSEEIKSEIEENIKLSKEIRKDLEDLKEKMLEKKELGFQEKKQIEELVEKQKKLKNSVEKLNKRNLEKTEIDKQVSKESEEIREKQEQLNELFEKVMSDEMKEMMKELEKLMKELNKDKIQEAIEKLELNNEDIEKELDRNLELFKQLEVEKELQESIDKLKEIEKKQNELKKETSEKKSKKEDLEKKQDSLNKEFEDLEKKLDKLEEKNKELESPNDIKRNSSLEEQIKEDMKESLESIQKNKKSDASENQEDAEEGMKKMQEEMMEIQMEMQSSQNAENLEDLRALLENLIQLSFDQEEVMNELKKTKIEDPNYVKLAQTQKKLKDDSKLIEDSLFALSKRVVQIQATVNREVSKINFNMDKAIEDLGERKTSSANSRQQMAMTSINNLALILDEAVQNMMMQMMQMNGECKKPGKKGGKPKPGGMKSMQEQLNKQMESLKKSMGQSKGKGEKGNNGSKPKQGSGKSQMSKELAQMAAKQAAIRKAIEQMESQMDGEGEGGKGSKSGKKLSELMEETETDLVNKRITNETILRQQEILTRLLQSEKAEREREKDEQRKSTEFTDNIFRNPNNILEYNRQKEIEMEFLQSMPPTLNSFYKSKVNKYFNDISK